jgi:hypothetical protein
MNRERNSNEAENCVLSHFMTPVIMDSMIVSHHRSNRMWKQEDFALVLTFTRRLVVPHAGTWAFRSRYGGTFEIRQLLNL